MIDGVVVIIVVIVVVVDVAVVGVVVVMYVADDGVDGDIDVAVGVFICTDIGIGVVGGDDGVDIFNGVVMLLLL